MAASLAFVALLTAALPFETLASAPSFQWFDARNFSTGGGSDEVAFHTDGGTVSLSGADRTVYGKLVAFTGTKLGFSTNFSFSVSAGDGPVSLAFLLVPAGATPPLNFTNEENRDWVEMSVLSVQYAASIGNWVEVNLDVPGEPPTSSEDISAKIGSGQKLQSWIDYDGESKKLEVRLINFGDLKLSGYSMHYYIDLSRILWSEEMLVGFSFWSRSSTRKSSIYSWGFELHHGGNYKMHSEPLDPNSLLPVKPLEDHQVHIQKTTDYPWKPLVMVVFGAAFCVLMMYAVLLLWSIMFDRRPVAPVEYPEKPSENEYEKVVVAADKVGVDKAAK